MSWMLGTDPERLIYNASKGAFVSAHTFFGDKDHKETIGKYGAQVFRDGYAVEFNAPPQGCRETLAKVIGEAMAIVQGRLLSEGCALYSGSRARITLAELKDAPSDVLVFGCDPSINAYEQALMRVELDASKHEWRYAGGHMHISKPMCYIRGKYSRDANEGASWMNNQDDVCLFVKMLDLYIGVPLTCLFPGNDTYERRKYYGKAGEFRVQNYGTSGEAEVMGIEYRTPGPEIWNHPAVASMAFGVMRLVANRFTALKKLWNPALEPAIRRAVDTGIGRLRLLQNVPGFYTADQFRTGIIPRSRMFGFVSFVTDSTLGWSAWKQQGGFASENTSWEPPVVAENVSE